MILCNRKIRKATEFLLESVDRFVLMPILIRAAYLVVELPVEFGCSLADMKRLYIGTTSLDF